MGCNMVGNLMPADFDGCILGLKDFSFLSSLTAKGGMVILFFYSFLFFLIPNTR